MRPLVYIAAFVAVLGLGFWAYREHYQTRDAFNQAADLQAEIAGLREALALQRAEWAYLNRPDRLRELSVLNFERLGLLPLEPNQFGDIATLSFPRQAPDMSGLVAPVDTVGSLLQDLVAEDPALAPLADPSPEDAP